MATDGFTPVNVHIDPFYDGEGTTAPGGSLVRPDRVGNYGDPSREILSTGRPMSAYMPQLRGLPGSVISPAGEGGVPIDFNPQELDDLEIHIDPHMPGQTSTLRLGQLTSEVINQGIATARSLTPEPRKIEMRRMRGAAAFHAMAANLGTGLARPADVDYDRPTPMAAPMAAPQYSPPQPSQYAEAPAVRRTSSPLAAFGLANRAVGDDRPLRHIDLSQAVQGSQATVGPPTTEVLFEIEGFGEHTVKYHDVLVADAFLVLIYDVRFVHGSKYFPPTPAQPGQPGPPLAMQIVGGADVYLVHTTGFKYLYDGREHCVLMIERKAPA